MARRGAMGVAARAVRGVARGVFVWRRCVEWCDMLWRGVARGAAKRRVALAHVVIRRDVLCGVLRGDAL